MRCEMQRWCFTMQRLRLSTRLTVVISAAALLLFGVAGAWHLQTEAGELRRVAAREMHVLGRSLQVAFENALRDRQREDVQETLSALEGLAPEVDVFVVDADGTQIAASRGAVERPHWRHPHQPTLRFTPDDNPLSAELLLPLQIAPGEPAATLVIWRPLTEMQADLVATRQRVGWSLLGFVAVIAIVTMMLSRAWVGAPLAKMIGHMRRVRAGDLSPTHAATRQDEVGETLREFEALVIDLAEARTKLIAEGEARHQLEEALRHVDKLTAVGQLAAGLAHEIGSPLQILEGRIAALQNKVDDPNEMRRIAGILLEQTQRITRIVSQLSSLARRRSIRMQRLPMESPVRAVVDLLEGEARRRGVTLTLTHDPETPAVEGDPDSLQQVSLNLLRNALDASRDGGHIEVRIGRGVIRRANQREEASARLVVQDDGCGMNEETQARAFDAFFTTRGAEGGTGLGLPIVKGIVDEHRGTLVVESELGRGTTVTIDIPKTAMAVDA